MGTDEGPVGAGTAGIMGGGVGLGAGGGTGGTIVTGGEFDSGVGAGACASTALPKRRNARTMLVLCFLLFFIVPSLPPYVAYFVVRDSFMYAQ